MKNQKNSITLGEGNTPLIRLFSLEKKLEWRGQIWAKAEYQNPTGSFKDRGSIVEIEEAIVQKKSGVVCASTGNMAASLAAYAARAKLSCMVVVPDKTPEGKLRQAIICGAKLVKVSGVYDDCVAKAKHVAVKNNLLLCGDYELRRISQRTISTELSKSKIRFDAFVIPVGNGTVGCAVAEGFAQNTLSPAFIGVQGCGADPIYQAWKIKASIKQMANPTTVASAMNVGNPLDGNLTLEWIQKTKGALYSVTNEEIVTAQKLLAETEGIFVEKAAAATVAAMKKINNKTLTIVLILTGSGLKES